MTTGQYSRSTRHGRKAHRHGTATRCLARQSLEPRLALASIFLAGDDLVIEDSGGMDDDRLDIFGNETHVWIRSNNGSPLTTTVPGAGGGSTSIFVPRDAFSGGITIDSKLGNDQIEIRGDFEFDQGGFDIDSQTILFDEATVSTTGGRISLSARHSIRLDSANLSTVDGGIALHANFSGCPTDVFDAVLVRDSTLLTTGNGDISIVGVGGNDQSTTSKRGISLSGTVSIDSTSTDPAAGTITINGTGGSGTKNNYGVSFGATVANVSSVSGDISIIGNAGGGVDGSNHGVVFVRSVSISSTGIGADAANILIDGTANDGLDSNFGVLASGEEVEITTVDGDVSIAGVGGDGADDFNIGAYLINIAGITSSGTGAHAGSITIDGTGGNGAGENYGVFIHGEATDITSVDGDVSITGQGGNGTANDNAGVSFENVRSISSTGTGTSAAAITISGNGGQGVSNNYGIVLAGDTTEITSVDGDISFSGQGGDGTGGKNSGIYFDDIARIASLGTDSGAARISLNGTGGAGVSQNHGVDVDGGGQTSLASGYGDITITGKGGEGSANHGVYLRSSASLSSTGIGAEAAKITIRGEGGTGIRFNYGVYAFGSAEIMSVDGDISIIGQGGTGNSHGQSGVVLGSGGSVSSTGTGPNAASITIEGTGGDGIANNMGVHATGATTSVQSIDGDISIVGQGGNGTGTGNHGISLSGIDTIASTGTGPNAATITIDGVGGTGTGNSIGVYLNLDSTDVSSVDGNLSISGRGGTGTGHGNVGVFAGRGARAQVTSANLTVDGIAGDGNSEGVELASSTGGQLLSLGLGEIHVTAAGNGNADALVATADSTIGGPLASGLIKLQSDAVTLGGTAVVQSSGDLRIRPRSAGTTIGLGGGAGTLNFDDDELARIADGFHSITIGETSTTGAVEIDTATFHDPVTIAGEVIRDGAGVDIAAPSVTFLGDVAPGQSPGELTVDSTLVALEADTLRIEIDGTEGAGMTGGHDQLTATGAVDLGDNVTLSLSGSPELTVGQRFTIVSRSGGSGIFHGLSEGHVFPDFLDSGYSASLSYAGGDGDDIVVTVGTAAIAQRLLFYNHSVFGDLGDNDDAIAIDKTALLPGQTASHDNMTSYIHGINGLMIDIHGMADPAAINASDFAFRIGRTDETNAWATLAALPTVDVRVGEGVAGADRIELTWPDGLIRNTWLEVTVKSTSNTVLPEADLFYFGNQVGETNGNGVVDGADFHAVRINPANILEPAAIDSAFDINRDTRVDAIDLLLVRDNATLIDGGLPMITPNAAVGKSMLPPEPLKRQAPQLLSGRWTVNMGDESPEPSDDEHIAALLAVTVETESANGVPGIPNDQDRESPTFASSLGLEEEMADVPAP